MEDKELVNKLNLLRKDTASLRNELNGVNEKKEYWFKQKEDLKKKLADLIGNIKQDRSKKDDFYKEIGLKKKERDEHNQKVKELIVKIKQLKKDKKKFSKIRRFRVRPNNLKEKIDRLNLALETEAYSFEKEKEVVKKIKNLEKAYKEVSALRAINEEINKVSREIDEAKRIADNAHKKAKSLKKDNKQFYKEIDSRSKEIENVKKEQKKAFDTFILFKQQFSAVDNQLREKLTELGKVQSLLQNNSKEFIKMQEEKVIAEKAQLVEEKIKKGKRLTTEDLIVFQKEEK